MRNLSSAGLGGLEPSDRVLPHPAWLRRVRSSPLAADELFHALDHAEVTTANTRWELEVFSITDDAGVRWLQLAVDGPVRQMATFRLEFEDGVSEVVSALASWLSGAKGHEQNLVSSL